MVTSRTIGRVTAWTVLTGAVAASAVQLLVPLAGILTAQFTWSGEELVACREAATPCVASTTPIGPYLAWVGLVPVVLVALALIVCWSPRRWWVGPGVERPARPGVFSTPEWFRLVAVGLVLLNACGLLVVSNRSVGVWMGEYAWPIVGSALLIGLATFSVRATAATIDPETRALLAREFPFWLSRRETALRAGTSVAQTPRAAAGSRRAAREARDERD